MLGFSYRRTLFWGFVTYSAVFFMWTVLSTYGLSSGLGAQIVGYIVTFVAVWGATYSIGTTSFLDAIKYGAGFAIVHIALDAVVVLPTIGAAAFYSPYVWIGYAIALLTSLLAMLYIRLRSPSSVPEIVQ